MNHMLPYQIRAFNATNVMKKLQDIQKRKEKSLFI